MLPSPTDAHLHCSYCGTPVGDAARCPNAECDRPVKYLDLWRRLREEEPRVEFSKDDSASMFADVSPAISPAAPTEEMDPANDGLTSWLEILTVKTERPGAEDAKRAAESPTEGGTTIERTGPLARDLQADVEESPVTFELEAEDLHRTVVATLEVVDGDAAGTLYPLYLGKSTIGKDDGCDIRLSDGAVSRRHATVDAERSPSGDLRFVVEDLDSRNGTSINRQRILRAYLVDGDALRVAERTLRFRCSVSRELSRAN